MRLREEVEAFDLTNRTENSVNATRQVLYDLGLFYSFVNQDEVLKDYITFNERRRGELEIQK